MWNQIWIFLVGWPKKPTNGSLGLARSRFESLSPDREPEFAEIKDLISKKPIDQTGIASNSKSLTTADSTSSDPVAIYMAEVRRYPLLTREQEQELARRYRETGDKRAAEALVTSNLRFVVKVAAEYSRFGARLIDLVQEGNVGLMHAVREFNPYKGVRLITYAVWWIRGYIQDYLMRQYSMVRIGTTQSQRKLFYRLQKRKTFSSPWAKSQQFSCCPVDWVSANQMLNL
jgi:RNA polymerase sigma-32 factor